MDPRPMTASFTVLLSGRRSRVGDGGCPAVEAREPGLLLFGQGVDGVQAIPFVLVARDPVQVTENHELAQAVRSEEHTSELQSPCNLVCRLLLEKKTRDAD